MDAFTARHLQGVSRTYAILVPMLPRPLDGAVGVAYLLMRVVDTLEDAPGVSNEERRALLSTLDAALNGDGQAAGELARPLGETEDEQALMCALPDVLARVQALPERQREAICGCARAMSDGVCRLMTRSEQRGQPYPAVGDAGELREYCYCVAGVVGEMLCAMMSDHLKLPALLCLRELAVELGIGLQLVNILKDSPKDSTQGRRYLPMTADGGSTPQEIRAAALGEARRCLQRGVDYVLALPATARRLRMFCGLPIAWGALTLARTDVDAEQAKISRDAVQSAIERFETLADDDKALRAWLLGLVHPGRSGRAAAAVPDAARVTPRRTSSDS